MRSCLFIFAALAFARPVFSQQKATTGDGKVVLLFDDGTWKSGQELQLNREPFPMERPPFSGAVFPATTKGNFFALSQLSASKNEITDETAWFINNSLGLREYEVPNTFRGLKGNVPEKSPLSYNGNMLVRAIHDDKYNFFIYGKDFASGWLLLITDKQVDSVLHFLDFGNYVLSPEYVKNDLDFIEQRINWVQAEDSVLYVSHGHSTYAASSKNMNAYITAINLKNYKIIWRSRPLVCNSSNFELYRDMLLCGYGFTAEPDFLYTLDKRSGAVVQKIPLKSGPSYIVRKADKVFVRTYNTDYVFGIK
jgi:hypothetical protein